jgi:TatD DNase family protein
MLFDTHAHYDDEKFDADRDEILSSMAENGVELIVDPASDIASAERARDIAEKYGFVYFAAGVHPHEAESAAPRYLTSVRELASHKKCVAIGEIGLDYHYDFSPRDVQKRVLDEQLALAMELNKPVIIHEREACSDCMDILRQYKGIRGVVHCYSGSWETAQELLCMGWYISFTGVVTFKNARRPVEVAQKMPLDRLMIETDSPYMAPVPMRGQRNSSLFLHFIAERIAELRGMETEELIKITTENGKRFFNIP